MVTIGTPLSPTATKVVLCGSGELGKEFVIELQRYGVEVIALDKYAHDEADLDNPKEIKVSKVCIELRQHIGMPAEAVVKVGDSVSEGQIIAAVPMDKVGANIHSSINGIVESVDTEKIVINGESVK